MIGNEDYELLVQAFDNQTFLPDSSEVLAEIFASTIVDHSVLKIHTIYQLCIAKPLRAQDRLIDRIKQFMEIPPVSLSHIWAHSEIRRLFQEQRKNVCVLLRYSLRSPV